MKKRLILLTGLLVGGVAGSGLHAIRAASDPQTEDNGYYNIAVLTRAIQLIRQDYVDEKKTSYRALTHAALKGMLNSLDPHTQFMEPKELKQMKDDTRSEFTGLGVTVTVRDGLLTIVTPMEDTPSSRAGLLPGDQILKINGDSTEKMELNSAVERLRGEPGEKVTLTILRPSTKEIKNYTMERAVIKVESVKDARVLDLNLTGGRKIGYVRITQFSGPTASDLARKLEELDKQGIEALVIDLRFNPGGLLDSAIDVCGQFLPPGTMVAYTEGRVPSQRRVYKTRSTSSRLRPNYPLAILINGGSASGSEIVAGALKDLDRAVIVGETSFGKGSVQSVLALMDGSGMRLTTAKYYTPSKQVIHEKGVAPQIRATMTPEQERLLFIQRREYLGPEEEELLSDFRDTQLERAVDALRGAVLYSEASGKPAEPPPAKPARRR